MGETNVRVHGCYGFMGECRQVIFSREVGFIHVDVWAWKVV